MMLACADDEGALMKFKYNRGTKRIESDDPAIYVKPSGSPREGGRQFVLTIDDQHIGFQTAADYLDDRTEMLPDGTKVWRIGEICCQVWRWGGDERGLIDLTNVRKLTDRDEQQRALTLFSEALSAFDGVHAHIVEGMAKARMEYTDEALAHIAAGEYLT